MAENYDAFIGVLGEFAKLAILAFVIERIIEFLFEWKPIRVRFDHWPIKAPGALLLSLAISAIFGFDIFKALFRDSSATHVGIVLTALFLAGGSAAAMSLFQNVLGLSQNVRRHRRDLMRLEREAQQAEATARVSSARQTSGGIIPARHAASGRVFRMPDLITNGSRGVDVSQLQAALRSLGFVEHPLEAGYFCEETSKALGEFQSFHGLKPDGIAGPVTKSLLERSRCGHPDRSTTGLAATQACIWQGGRVTYKILNNPATIELDRCKEIIRKAFESWQQVCDLRFTEVDAGSPSNIRIYWQAPDQIAAIGPLSVYAYGFFPPPCGGDLAGDIVFDSSESWVDDEIQPVGDGYNLRLIATHEIGHAIGLDHSPSRNDLMYAYPQLVVGGRLSQGDADAVRQLYA